MCAVFKFRLCVTEDVLVPIPATDMYRKMRTILNFPTEQEAWEHARQFEKQHPGKFEFSVEDLS